MKFLLTVAFACQLAFGAALPCTSPCIYGPKQVTHSGIARYYAAYFPTGISASVPYHMIVVLNGANIVPYNSPKLNAQSLLQSFADAHQVAILWILSAAYDTGASPGAATQPYSSCTTVGDACQWVWRLPFDFTSFYTDYDDLNYITDRITNAETAWGADSTRVLLIGGSTGGLEAHAYAQANPDKITAIGTFAGPVWAGQNDGAPPTAPTGNVTMFMVHGDADTTLSYCGGATSNPWYGLSGITTASADETFDYWAGANGMNCSAITPATNLCPASSGVFQKVAMGCDGAKKAMFIRYPGADHSVANYTYELLTAFWNFVFAGSNPTTSALVSSPNPSAYGQPVALTGTVSSTFGMPTGKVAFVRDGVTVGTSTLGGGKAMIIWVPGPVGTKSIASFYTGSANFMPSLSTTTLNQVVIPAATTTTLVSSANPATIGQAAAFTASVTALYGGTPTGTVTFVRNGTTIGTAALSSGQATLSWGFNSVGMKSIIAIYSGDANFATSTSNTLNQAVSQTTVTTLVSSLNFSNVGQAATFTATVTGQSVLPTGTVTFIENGTTLGAAALSGGQATLNWAFNSVGMKSITAVYSGDPNSLTSSSTPMSQIVSPATTTAILISSLNPSTFGQSLILTAKVTGRYGGTPTGIVTFVENGTTVGTEALSSGQATFNRTFSSAGTKSIIAVYSGDSNFITSTSATLTQMVVPAATATSLISSLNPTSVEQSVVLTTTVAHQYGGTPTGAVTFVKNGATFGTSALIGGQATLNWTFGSSGVKPIIVVYSGDPNFTTSTSTTLNQAVIPATTTTTLVALPNPSTVGQSVTFTATVVAQYGGTPTGTITFKNGATTLGMAALTGGQATLHKTFTSAGTKSITAIYSGDANFTMSSGMLMQTVN